MKQILHILFFTYCLSNTIFPQNPEWINYTSGNENNAVVVDSNYVWVGTNGGLVKIDRLTGEKEFLNCGNSGLPDNYILSLAVDSEGSLWIGTWLAGLAKFDGNNWSYYNTHNSRFPSNRINTMVADRFGNIWIGSFWGLAKFDGTDWTFISASELGLSALVVSCIVFDSSDNMWIGTESSWGDGPRGIAKYDGSNWRVYTQNNSGLPDNEIRCLAVDNLDNIWIGTRHGGAAKFDGTNWKVFNESNSGLPGNDAAFITIDEDDNKWIAGGWDGLAKFDGSSWTVYNENNSALPNCRVTCIAIDDSNIKWIGTNPGRAGVGNGIVMFDGTNWEMISTSNSGLPGNWIRSVTIDADGNKWIGTHERGLAKFDDQNWITYDQYNSGYPNNRVSCIEIDEFGNKWIGTWAEGGWTSSGDGIVKFDGTEWTTFDTDNSGLPSNNVRCIAIDKSGNKWIGTADGYYEAGGGLIKYDDTDWTIYDSTNSGLPSNSVGCLAIDENENLWIGTTDGGIVKFDGNNWTTYNTSNSGLPGNYVSSIVIDKDNNKWIGTFSEWNGSQYIGGGLAMFDGTGWTVYNASNSGLPSNTVNCIAIDDSGNKWIGTSTYRVEAGPDDWQYIGGGLAMYDGTSWTVYEVSKSGLPNNDLYCISIDESDNKWIGTFEGGLTVFNEDGIVTDMKNDLTVDTVPEDYVLYQNYPNPFNPSTVIEYSIPFVERMASFAHANNGDVSQSGDWLYNVTLNVYDVLGREVAILVNEHQRPGSYKVSFDATGLSSGVYFYKLSASKYVDTKKMILLR